MQRTLRNRSRYILGFLAALLLFSQPAWAGRPPEPSIFSNSLAVILIIVMILLLIVIGILGTILIGAADVKMKKRKLENSTAATTARLLLFALFIPAGSLLAQDATGSTAAVVKTIGGLQASTFYLM